jgi:CubicO group peptidase (beta-lactamase class C family)
MPVVATELSMRDRVDAIVAPYLEARDFMGVAAVQRDGEEALLLPYGFASVELGVPQRKDSVFMIGSVSKQFTAAAVLALEEAGALSTADTVAKHLPEFPHGSKMTIEQLLTHAAGVADIYSLERFGAGGGRVGTFEEVLEDIGRAELAFSPGTGYAYSNGGYAVLAAVIEQVSGVSYGEYLRRRFFAPLGMSQTSHDGPSAATENRVPGYDPWGLDDLSPAIPVSAAFTTGSGSLWSSAGDLLKWSAALHGGRVLSGASYDKLTRDQGNGYGYGVSVFQRFGLDVIGHDGRVAGYSSDLARYVDEKTTIVILSNVQSVARDEIRRLVAAAVFGEDYTVPAVRKFLEEPPAPLDDLVGVYSFGPGFDVSIAESGGRLLARANQGGYSELVPVDAETWFSRMLYAAVRFGRDGDGAVDRLTWGSQEGAPVGRKLR